MHCRVTLVGSQSYFTLHKSKNIRNEQIFQAEFKYVNSFFRNLPYVCLPTLIFKEISTLSSGPNIHFTLLKIVGCCFLYVFSIWTTFLQHPTITSQHPCNTLSLIQLFSSRDILVKEVPVPVTNRTKVIWEEKQLKVKKLNFAGYATP